MRTIIAVISDTHAGNRYALMNPETVLFAENEHGDIVEYHPELTESQRYLWTIYTDGVRKTAEIARGDSIYLLHLGDEVDGNKYPQAQVTSRMSDQITIAAGVFAPWYELDNLASVRIVIGTQAHNFGEGSSALLVCGLLPKHPEAKPLYHGLLDVNGVVIDYSHHGPFPNSRNWLAGNSARFYLRDLMQREIMSGTKPPDIVLRGHYHTPVYEYLETNGFASRLYILPSWSMMTDHARQATMSAYEVIHGMLVLEIEDGQIVRDYRLYHKLDLRRREKL